MIRLVVLLMAAGAVVNHGRITRGADIEPRFQLSTIQGEEFLCEPLQSQATVVCFLGTECPLARLYGARLQRLADEFADEGVTFVGVFSNQQDSLGDIRTFIREYSITFPVAKDSRNLVADQFLATRTPEVVLLDRQLKVRYRGRIDDQYRPGSARSKPERHDLREALADLVAGRPITAPETEPQGCLIGRVKQPIEDSEFTFCNQIVRILNRRCLECHRAGEIGPFALTDYEEVVGWAEMIQEVVDECRMPPWHAADHSLPMVNARLMPDAEKRAIRKWVAAGAPYGDESQLPEMPEFVAGWQLPQVPDLVLPMRNRPFTVPADGTVEYQYFVVDPEFEEDHWVMAAQVVPGNPAVVHHAIVFIRPPDGLQFRGVGWMTAYVPGQRLPLLLPGHARRIPAGSKLVFQMHYTPNGDIQEDLSKVGLVFMNEAEVTDELLTLVGIEQEFEIPPHDGHVEVEASVGWFPRDGKLLAISPHMHVRGKSFLVSNRHGNEYQLLLDVPRYDFNWQHVYQLEDPLPLNEVDDLHFVATFDNSSANPTNPDPTEFVTWGDQTWEEMAVAFYEVSQPRNRPGPSPLERTSAGNADQLRRLANRTEAFLADFFDRFDQDKDGQVHRDETPIGFRRFGFRQFDADGDRILTEKEVRDHAQTRFKRR